jgi:predicted ATPase
MRVKKFTIENFKGIKKTTIDFPDAPTSVTTLVGLNESGKTTILEALDELSNSLKSDPLKTIVPKEQASSKNRIIPKSKLGNFSDEIKIAAEFELDPEEVEDVVGKLDTEFDGVYSLSTNSEGNCPIKLTRKLTFLNSELKETDSYWSTVVNHKSSNRVKHWKKIKSSNGEIHRKQWIRFVEIVKNNYLPSIIYYPIFYFNFPEKIFLSPKPDEDERQNFYRDILQQILNAHPEKYDLKEHVVDRISPNNILNPKLQTDQYLPQMIQKVMTAMEAVVTQLIFKSWNEIFGNSFQNRNIKVTYSYETVSGKTYPYIRFDIVQDGDLYPIADRSLGFRWFFCFLLFTVFKEQNTEGTIFLIDEPASSLHATAQAKLLEKFRLICGEHNSIIYTTHSHHMINPNWLESSYIVSNEAVSPDDALAFSLKPTEIVATKIKRFLSESQDKTVYYQPILEKLHYRKSGIELGKDAILLEGKTDFYVLSYFKDVYYDGKYSDLNFVPGTGAGSLSTLISLHSGWGVNFYIHLDSDTAGEESREKYINDHFLEISKFTSYESILGDSKYKTLEKLFTGNDVKIIKSNGGKKLKKSIPVFFPLAQFQDKKYGFDEKTIKNFEKILKFFQNQP